ncbi:MAG TPA: hypothetical protein VFN35_20580 [Ktedonobacteraceae bacterium]|nr:hypothetical protein [Ktedonobacteraceae bacterium]
MQQLDFSLFQPLNGSAPFRFVSAHPTEPFVALQASLDLHVLDTPIFSRSNIRCSIWNRETREIISEPEDVVALAWNAEGSEIGLVREYYQGPDYDPASPRSFFRYTWERYSWPEQTLIHSCALSFDTNWPEIVVFSPLGDLAVVQWFEAEKSGLDFIGLTRYGDRLLEETELLPLERETDSFAGEEDGRCCMETNLATQPVFSPDGRAIVFCWQPRQRWWTDVPDDMYVEGELPARVGECHIGYAQIIDWETSSTYHVALFANLPPGWQPSYEGDISNELLQEPVFMDDQHFQVQLPTGETRVYNIFTCREA